VGPIQRDRGSSQRIDLLGPRDSEGPEGRLPTAVPIAKRRCGSRTTGLYSTHLRWPIGNDRFNGGATERPGRCYPASRVAL